MIIYKKDGTQRATIHETSDSEEVREISGEEYCSIKYISSVYTEFSVGDILYSMVGDIRFTRSLQRLRRSPLSTIPIP